MPKCPHSNCGIILNGEPSGGHYCADIGNFVRISESEFLCSKCGKMSVLDKTSPAVSERYFVPELTCSCGNKLEISGMFHDHCNCCGCCTDSCHCSCCCD